MDVSVRENSVDRHRESRGTIRKWRTGAIWGEGGVEKKLVTN